MTDQDAWGVLNTRYRHDSDAQFVLFVDQLAEVRELLLSDTTPKHRMALVALDNLAEVVLHRHKRSIQRLAEADWPLRSPRLSRSDVRELNSDFGARVRLGRRGGEDGLSESILRPVLDEVDDALFRTGHAYRNRVYHADHHNIAVLQLIARGYAGAVGRAFVRLQPTNTAGSMSAAMRDHLARYGYTGSEGWGIPAAFAPSAAAEAIVTHLIVDLEPSLSAAKSALSKDIAWRTDWADDMIAYLLAEPGITVERFEWALRWGEFWDAHGRDDEIVARDRELSEVWHRIVETGGDGGDHDAGFAQISELQKVRNVRVQELLQGFVPKFDLVVIDQTRKLGKRLANARNIGALSIRYQKLDETLETVESILDDMAIGWDRHVQEEEDRARGK